MCFDNKLFNVWNVMYLFLQPFVTEFSTSVFLIRCCNFYLANSVDIFLFIGKSNCKQSLLLFKNILCLFGGIFH